MNHILAFDRTEARVRLLPSLIAGLPLVVAILFCFPSLRDIASAAALAALLLVGSQLVAELARPRDKTIERQLREKGRGPHLLMWADPEIETGLKKEMHAALAKSFPEFPLLNPQEEKLENNSARTLCADVISALERSFGDREKYPLIHAELMSLRFRRNVLSLKPYILASCRAGALLAIACALLSPEGSAPITISLVAACICTGAAFLFANAVTFQWVAGAEREYTKHMLLALVGEARASQGGRWAAMAEVHAPRLRQEIGA